MFVSSSLCMPFVIYLVTGDGGRWKLHGSGHMSRDSQRSYRYIITTRLCWNMNETPVLQLTSQEDLKEESCSPVGGGGVDKGKSVARTLKTRLYKCICN